MKISIPKNIISELPQVTFPGNIYVIDSMSKMSMAVNALRKERFVGFDSETRPAFFKGKTNQVALLQISSLDDCFLFRINKIGIPEKLKQFIEDESVKKIGLSLNNDFNAMGRFAEITPRGFIDIQDLAKQYCIADMSLQRIYAILIAAPFKLGSPHSHAGATAICGNRCSGLPRNLQLPRGGTFQTRIITIYS